MLIRHRANEWEPNHGLRAHLMFYFTDTGTTPARIMPNAGAALTERSMMRPPTNGTVIDATTDRMSGVCHRHNASEGPLAMGTGHFIAMTHPAVVGGKASLSLNCAGDGNQK